MKVEETNSINSEKNIIDKEDKLKIEIIDEFISDKLNTNDDITQNIMDIDEFKKISLKFTVESLLLLSEILKNEKSISKEKIIGLLEEIEINNDLNNYNFTKTLQEWKNIK